MILLIDEEGKVIRSLHDSTGKVVVQVTEAFEIDDELIIGSFTLPYISRLKL